MNDFKHRFNFLANDVYMMRQRLLGQNMSSKCTQKCRVPKCKINHASHYCKICKDTNSDHFSSRCVELILKHQQQGHRWTHKNHYGQCGQSCPCCRWFVEGDNGLGACKICQECSVPPLFRVHKGHE